MSYKEKAAGDVGEYRGGALTVKPPIQRLRYPCFADQCPMPGTIFPGQILGDKSGGVCAWHYGIGTTDIPKVTRALLDWQCVSFEINECRRVLTGELASNPGAIDRMFASAWERLRGCVDEGWQAQLQPGNIRSSKGVDRGFREGYGDWAKRLEQFLGARVVEVLAIRQRAAA